MTLTSAIFLFVAGILGGVLNAVAGGGTFVVFPALMFMGVPPIPANATNTVSLWLGTAASTRAYRHHLNIPRRVLLPLLITGTVGSVAGAFLLVRTPAHTFLHAVPWLMLLATLLFAFGGYLGGLIHAGEPHDLSREAVAGMTAAEAAVAIYGGYFGGGIGIMNLAMFAAMGMTDIHAMNALKVILVAVINGTAMVTFIVTRTVYWPQTIVITAGALLGGYYGAHYSQRLPQSWVRGAVIATGVAMTAYFFVKAYL